MFTFTLNGTDHSVTTDGTTDKRAVAVYLRDVGMSNAEIGAAFADVFGKAITDGSAGNLVVGGLRDLGRGSEIEASHTGRAGRLPRVEATGAGKALSDEINALVSRIEAVEKAVNEAGTPPNEDTLRTRLVEAVERATKALNEFNEDPSSAVEAAVKAHGEKAEATRTAAVEPLKAIRESLADLASGVEALAKAKLVKTDEAKAMIEAATVGIDRTGEIEATLTPEAVEPEAVEPEAVEPEAVES